MSTHLVPPCTCEDPHQHFVSASCGGEKCSACASTGLLRDATHKLGEEIPYDDPIPIRHNLTAYVCCSHFRLIVGPAAGCKE